MLHLAVLRVCGKWNMRISSVLPDLRNMAQYPVLMPDCQEHTQVHLTLLHLSEAGPKLTVNQQSKDYSIGFYLKIIQTGVKN